MGCGASFAGGGGQVTPQSEADQYLQKLKARRQKDAPTEVYIETETMATLQKETSKIKQLQQKKDRDDKALETEIRPYFEELCKWYSSLDEDTLSAERKTKIVKFLLESGCVSIVCMFIADGLQSEKYLKPDQKVAKRATVDDHIIPLMSAMEILSMCLKESPDIAREVVNHSRLLSIILKKLKKWRELHRKRHLSRPEEEVLLRDSLYIVHYITTHVTRVRTLAVCGVMEGYLKSRSKENRLMAIATLAEVMSEDDAESFSETKKMKTMFGFLLDHLRQALSDPSHRSEGWRAAELLGVVHQLAQKESFQRPLVEAKLIPSLQNGVESSFDRERERIESLKVLWTLSFEEEIVREMMKSANPVDCVYKLHRENKEKKELHQKKTVQLDQEEEIRLNQLLSTTEGILWNLKSEMQKSKNAQYKEIAQDNSPKEQDKTEPHIMLSYQHDYQKIVTKISKFLEKNGFKVWMDTDKMRQGCILDIMAKAVENAFVVLMCFSESYKESDSCRSEAVYAYKRHIPRIPLRMQTDYDPDGWLGLLLGVDFYHDFSEGGEGKFQGSVNKLLEAIHEIRGTKATGVQSEVESARSSGEPERISEKPVATYTTSEVSDRAAQPAIATENHVNTGDTPGDRKNPMELTPGSSQDWQEDLSSEDEEFVVVPRPLSPRTEPVRRPRTRSSVDEEKIRAWSRADVMDWLDRTRLKERKLESLTGLEILYLRRLRSENPDMYHTILAESLEVRSLPRLVKFSEALDDLVSE